MDFFMGMPVAELFMITKEYKSIAGGGNGKQ